jgi:hypothetical protein
VIVTFSRMHGHGSNYQRAKCDEQFELAEVAGTRVKALRRVGSRAATFESGQAQTGLLPQLADRVQLDTTQCATHAIRAEFATSNEAILRTLPRFRS